MHTILRKRGKSVALVLPNAVLKRTGAGAGTMVDLRVEDGHLIITPVGGPTLKEAEVRSSA